MHARILIITVIGTASFAAVQDADTLNQQPPIEREAAIGEISFQRTEAEIRVFCGGEIFASLHF